MQAQEHQLSFKKRDKEPEELQLYDEFNELMQQGKIMKQVRPSTTATRQKLRELKNQLLELKRQIWVAKGVRKHSLDTDKLRRVMERFRKIGKVPKGYLFPELML